MGRGCACALQSNLSSAIIAAGPPFAESAKSVTGAGSLVGWATGTRRTFTVWCATESTVLTVTCSGTSPVACTSADGRLVTFPIVYTERAASAYADGHDLGPDPYS